MTQLGEGLVFRGPFTYRRASKYGVYGSRNELVSAGTFPGLSFRDHFTGKEDQKPDFGIPYSDHGARLYAPSLRRWMIPDPLSEKYYGISPYAYCADNPLLCIDDSGLDIRIFGAQGSAVVVKTGLIDISADITRIGLDIDFGGIFTFTGDDILSAALDIAGCFDQSGVSDALCAGIALSNGQYVDALISGISIIPAVGDVAKIGKVQKDVKIIQKAVSTVKYTRRNFRKNLAKMVGEMPADKEAHHIFPVKFIDDFNKIGIDIHDPRYGVFLDSKMHNKGSYQYNIEWKNFLDTHPNATIEEAIDFGQYNMLNIYDTKVF